MSATTFIAVVGLIVAALALGVSAWVALMQRRNLSIAGSANGIQDAIRDLASRDLTLTAYANAIQGGILDVKRTFADHPEIFYRQMQMNPAINNLIPEYMREVKEGIPTFLAFAGGMWRLSYVYSVMERGEMLGLNKDEIKGLNDEMQLWLTGVPGFYHVYKTQVEALKVHNKRFLDYLDKLYNGELELYDGRTFPEVLAERWEYDQPAREIERAAANKLAEHSEQLAQDTAAPAAAES
jgi:hypothetical protein